VDPTGLTLPVFVVNKVYAIDVAPGTIVLATPATSVSILGFYIGVDDGGFLMFEQERIVIEAAFTARGTRWYLAAGGLYSTVASQVELGVAISADALMLTCNRDEDVSGITGVGVDDSAAGTATNVQLLDIISDLPGGIPFATVAESPAGTATISIDKQVTFNALAASVAGAPTGFSFVAANYRAVELFYAISGENDKFECGSIYMLHDATNALVAIRVDRVQIVTGEPAVTFGIDLNAGNCRLLYTETAGNDLNLVLKPRAIIAADFV
jgi:hypothetical protein